MVSLSSRHYLIFRDLCGPYHTLKLEQNQKEILSSSTFQEEEASEGRGDGCTTMNSELGSQHQVLFCILTFLPPKDSGLTILNIDYTGEIQCPLGYKFLCDSLML